MKQLLMSSLFILGVSIPFSAYSACNPNMVLKKPDSIYIDHGNGTVTDKQTGLMWQKCSIGQVYNAGACSGTVGMYNWQDALGKAQLANTSTVYGYNNWHLPNVKELASLVETACYDPAINNLIFPATPYVVDVWRWQMTGFWTSTSRIGGFSARVMSFQNESIAGYEGKNVLNYVRLVRDVP